MIPEVSVVIPVHNGAKTLPKALDSALCQRVELEIIVIDDCSEDDLEHALIPYGRDDRVRVLKNEKNLGAAASRNRGVKEARGNYVAFLDSDDYWAPGKLEKQLQQLKQGNYVLCSTARELMTPEGELTGRMIGVKEKITYRELLRHNSILSCAEIHSSSLSTAINASCGTSTLPSCRIRFFPSFCFSSSFFFRVISPP